jgi:hypothetical protein
VPWEACTGNYLPALSSVIPNDQQLTTLGDDSQVTVSQFVNRLDTYLAMPVEEVVWPTLASAWEASGATMHPTPATEEVPAQQQGQGTDNVKAAQVNLKSVYGIESSSQTSQQQEIFFSTQKADIPSAHGGDCNGSESSSDYEMDIDEEESDHTTPSSGEVELMDVDEEVAPIINAIQYPKLEAEWRHGIPQYVRKDFLHQVSLARKLLLVQVNRC